MDEDDEEDSFEFEFYEVVRIADAPGTGRDVTGTALGRSRDEDGEEWYTLAVDGRADAFSIEGARLCSTGEHRPREDFYDGSTLRVNIEGEVLDDW